MRTRLSIGGAVLALAAALSVAPALAKKTPGGKRIEVTTTVNQQVPLATTSLGQLVSTTEISNKLKGRRIIRDVNVGVFASGEDVSAISARLTAPNGATVDLVGVTGTTGQSWGAGDVPLTLDDESRLFISPAPPGSSPSLLAEPYAGSAMPQGNIFGSGKPLAIMDGGDVRGTWTLRIEEWSGSEINSLNFWRLSVRVGEPYRTKS